MPHHALLHRPRQAALEKKKKRAGSTAKAQLAARDSGGVALLATRGGTAATGDAPASDDESPLLLPRGAQPQHQSRRYSTLSKKLYIAAPEAEEQFRDAYGVEEGRCCECARAAPHCGGGCCARWWCCCVRRGAGASFLVAVTTIAAVVALAVVAALPPALPPAPS